METFLPWVAAGALTTGGGVGPPAVGAETAKDAEPPTGVMGGGLRGVLLVLAVSLLAAPVISRTWEDGKRVQAAVTHKHECLAPAGAAAHNGKCKQADCMTATASNPK